MPPEDDDVANSASNEALLRQLLAGHAEISAEVRGLAKRVDGVEQAAREARDAARDSAAATKAQDIPAQIEKLRGEVQKLTSEGRSDLVNAISRATEAMRKGHDDHEARIKGLEEAQSELKGATGVLGWISRNAPWLSTMLAAVGGFFWLKDHH